MEGQELHFPSILVIEALAKFGASVAPLRDLRKTETNPADCQWSRRM